MTNKKYQYLTKGIYTLLEESRRQAARSINAILTATYWEIGRRVVEFEQSGSTRAEYGHELIARLSQDLTKRFGKGYSERNLLLMRAFYLEWQIPQTVSAEFQNVKKDYAGIPDIKTNKMLKHKSKRLNWETDIDSLASIFPLSWSHYARLLSVPDCDAREFYETESLSNSWTVRQLDRQISTQFYERTLLSRKKIKMLRRSEKKKADDSLRPEDAIRDPYILEFLELKDEYSENDLEDALIKHLEAFLLELGGDFAFISRQKRLKIGNEWFRVDLLFYHRNLQCLVVIDLKIGKFTHADAGQMHMYLNFARENWARNGENPPVGLILCAEKDKAVAKYSLDGLSNKVLAAEYKLALPNEKALVKEAQRIVKRLNNGHSKNNTSIMIR